MFSPTIKIFTDGIDAVPSVTLPLTEPVCAKIELAVKRIKMNMYFMLNIEA